MRATTRSNKFLKALFALLAGVFFAGTGYAQQVEGIVSDAESDEGIPGVNVLVKGSSQGTSTGPDGMFSLNVNSLQDTLVFSFIGYQTQEVPIDGRTDIEVFLQPQTISGDDVVVIGYGTTTKRELTGSVSSVSPDEFNQGSITDPMQLLQGKVAGLSITQTNGGDPTSGYEIRLRGSSSLSASQEPLIVIDGVPGGDLNNINPENIESVDILKDGSAAAIYGTRGTNGVVLVTTKQGEAGNFQIDYSGKFTTQSVLRSTDVLSAGQYREMKDRLSSTNPDVANNMVDHGNSTNWFDEITRSPVSNVHSLALSGGMENTTYRASVFYSNQEGILLNSAEEEYRVNLNLQQSAVNDRLQMDLRLGVTDRMQNPVDYNAIRQAIRRNPTEPVYNEDGSLFEDYGAWQYENPVGILTERENDAGSNNYYGNINASFLITDNIEISALAGTEVNNWLNGYYEPSYSYPQEVQDLSGFASRSAGEFSTNTFESTIEWGEDFSSHSFNIIGGYSYQHFNTEDFGADNTNFITDGFSYNNLGTGTYLNEGQANLNSYREESTLVGYFSRGTYNYDRRYFLSASVRYEGSSKFGSENEWGVFPAVSAAWDLSNESFTGFLDDFDLFKLRAGFGVTGNEGIDPYLALQRLGPSGYFFYEGQFVPGYQPVSNPNPNLKWETKDELNIGLDWALNDGRLGGAVEYYRRDTNDLLHTYDVPVPPNLYGSTFANVGSMRNSGLEVTLNTVPVQTQNLNWNLDLNFEYRKNELLSLSNEEYSLDYRNVGEVGPPGIEAWTHRYEPGRSIGSIHAYEFEGFTDEGEWIFRDVNEDGEITTEDRTFVGNGVPDFYAGFSSRLNYKNWDFSVALRGMFGHQIVNHKRIFYDNPKFLPDNIMTSAMDTELWDDPDYSSYYVEDGDFIKVDNVTLGYTLPIQNMGFKSGRIFLSGNNLLMITGYSGLDPELAIGGLTPGFDSQYDYPSTRSFTLGLNLSF